jgi:hypothetical protein
MAEPFEHGKCPSGCIKGHEIIDFESEYYLLKKDSAVGGSNAPRKFL